MLFLAAFTIVLCTGCYPLDAFWNQFDVALQLEGYKYSCWYNEQADIMAASIISALQDAVTALLPTLLYWNLRIPRRQKIALAAVFASAYLVVAVCMVRVYAMWEIFNNPMYDGTWTTWPALLLVIIEVYLGATLASVPALKVFARHYFEGGLSSSSSNHPSDAGLQPALFGRRQHEEAKFLSVSLQLSVLSRADEADEERDVTLLERKKSETRDVGTAV